MINREATIRWKGYDPDELKSNSSKKVWVNCDKCEKGRWINLNQYRSLCNKCAMIARRGIKRSPEICKKISDSQMGHIVSEDTKRKMSENHPDMSGENNPMCGKKHSNKTRSKISEKLKYKNMGENNPMKRSDVIEKHKKNVMRGENHPSKRPEVIEKISKSAKERYKDKTNHPMYGKHHSEETKRKISYNHADISGDKCYWYGKKLSFEHIKNISVMKQGISYEEWDGFSESDWRDWNKAIYVNEPFIECHRHHMTETIVVHIPEELHRHIYHNLKKGTNMGEINTLAIQFINGGL